MTTTCEARYERPDGSLLYCQYLVQHPGNRHSWETIKEADKAEMLEVDKQIVRAQQGDGSVQEFLLLIASGKVDTFLEAILAVTHNRKRTIRNLRGFPNLERRHGT